MGSEERSRCPLRSPHRTASWKEDRVIEMRRRYGWGARKLRELLLREGLTLPAIMIHRILVRHGMIGEEKRDHAAVLRFERSLCNELWQVDFKGEYSIAQSSGGYCSPLSILDDHSRYGVGLYGLSHPRGNAVQQCLVESFERHGVPEAILMDHGTPWWSTTNHFGLTWLSVFLMKQGIELLWSGVGHPQTQRKVERFHRTLEEAVVHSGKPGNLTGWQNWLAEFRRIYNEIRPHESLGMAVPASTYSPSRKAYNPYPPVWEYEVGSLVKNLNSQGMVEYHGRRYFVCESLAGEPVQIIPVRIEPESKTEDLLLVRYRRTYVREIELATGRSRPPAPGPHPPRIINE